jgi:hypothetical protein
MNKFFTASLLAISFACAVPASTQAQIPTEPATEEPSVKEKAQAWVDTVKQTCTDHPYLVAGSAAGAALLVAFLIDMGKGQNNSYLRTWINGTPHDHVELRSLMANLNEQNKQQSSPTDTAD